MVSRMNSQKNPQRNQTAAQAEIEPDVAAEIRARLDFTHWPVLLMRMPGQGRGRASVLLSLVPAKLGLRRFSNNRAEIRTHQTKSIFPNRLHR